MCLEADAVGKVSLSVFFPLTILLSASSICMCVCVCVCVCTYMRVCVTFDSASSPSSLASPFSRVSLGHFDQISAIPPPGRRAPLLLQLLEVLGVLGAVGVLCHGAKEEKGERSAALSEARHGTHTADRSPGGPTGPAEAERMCVCLCVCVCRAVRENQKQRGEEERGENVVCEREHTHTHTHARTKEKRKRATDQAKCATVTHNKRVERREREDAARLGGQLPSQRDSAVLFRLFFALCSHTQAETLTIADCSLCSNTAVRSVTAHARKRTRMQLPQPCSNQCLSFPLSLLPPSLSRLSPLPPAPDALYASVARACGRDGGGRGGAAAHLWPPHLPHDRAARGRAVRPQWYRCRSCSWLQRMHGDAAAAEGGRQAALARKGPGGATKE